MSQTSPVRRLASLFAAVALAATLGAGCSKPMELSPVEVTLKLDRDPGYYEPGDVAYAAITIRNVNTVEVPAAKLTTGTVSIYASRVLDDSAAKPPARQNPTFTDAPTMADGTLTLASGGTEQVNWAASNLPTEPGNYVLYVKYRNTARMASGGPEVVLSNQVRVTIE